MSYGRHATKTGIDAIKVIADGLNQPLFAITANTEAISRLLAREAPDLVEVRAALSDITSDAQRVSRMVGTVQRLLAATQESPADIVVRDLVDECVVEMRTEMFAQRVACEVQTAPHLPTAKGAWRCARCCTTRAPSRSRWRIPASASPRPTRGASSTLSSPPSHIAAGWASPSAAT